VARELGDSGSSDGPDRPGVPTWVKVFGAIGIILALLFVVLLITGGPDRHGPERHSSGHGSGIGPASVASSGLTR